MTDEKRSLGSKLIEGLEDAIVYHKGGKELKTTVVTDEKPRELPAEVWIGLKELDPCLYFSPENGGAHFIENSAYLAVTKERDSFKINYNLLMALQQENKRINTLRAKAISERDAFKSLIEHVRDAAFDMEARDAESILKIASERDKLRDTPGGKRLYSQLRHITKQDETIKELREALEHCVCLCGERMACNNYVCVRCEALAKLNRDEGEMRGRRSEG